MSEFFPPGQQGRVELTRVGRAPDHPEALAGVARRVVPQFVQSTETPHCDPLMNLTLVDELGLPNVFPFRIEAVATIALIRPCSPRSSCAGQDVSRDCVVADEAPSSLICASASAICDVSDGFARFNGEHAAIDLNRALKVLDGRTTLIVLLAQMSPSIGGHDFEPAHVAAVVWSPPQHVDAAGRVHTPTPMSAARPTPMNHCMKPPRYPIRSVSAPAAAPKRAARRLKSVRFTVPSKLKSPWLQRRFVPPKFAATRLKSLRFTRPSRLASP